MMTRLASLYCPNCLIPETSPRGMRKGSSWEGGSLPSVVGDPLTSLSVRFRHSQSRLPHVNANVPCLDDITFALSNAWDFVDSLVSAGVFCM